MDHPQDVAPIAEMVARGIAPLNSREAAETALRVRDHRQVIITNYLRELPLVEGLVDESCAWCEFLGCKDSSDLLIARVLQRFADVRCRDEAIWSLIPECVELGEVAFKACSMPPAESEINHLHRLGEPCATLASDVALSRLLEALPGVPERWRPTWLCFISLTRWRSGDHTGASMAAQCAAEESPESLARLCCTLLELRQPYQDFCGAAPVYRSSNL